MKKGLFITFEGIEGSGKSTQAQLLKEYLVSEGRKVFLTREPGGPKISEQIREILLSNENKEMSPETELLLYLAARSQHTSECIIPALNRGEFVICDRYIDSTLAYQGIARELNLGTVIDINEFATYGLKPDLTFILDLPTDLLIYRLLKKRLDRIESESIEFHNKVRDAFLNIAKYDERYIVMDSRDDIYVLHEKIKNIILNKIQTPHATIQTNGIIDT